MKVFFKIFRKIFKSIVSGTTLNEFELLTYVAEIERILNNRPITRLPSSPCDWDALTPNAILTRSLIDDSPQDKIMKADAYRSSWKKTQYLSERFWHQWINQYLPLLQPKQKWFADVKNLETGDLVLVADESNPRGLWPKAIVTKVIPDREGLVRRVHVRTADGTILQRDIRKICLLEEHINDSP